MGSIHDEFPAPSTHTHASSHEHRLLQTCPRGPGLWTPQDCLISSVNARGNPSSNYFLAPSARQSMGRGAGARLTIFSSRGNTTAVTDPQISHNLSGLTRSKFISRLPNSPVRVSGQWEAFFHMIFQGFRFFQPSGFVICFQPVDRGKKR